MGINDFRAQNGLPPLVPSASLSLLARLHADNMLASGFFDHTAPDGTTFEQRVGGALVREGYKTWVAHENIARAHEHRRKEAGRRLASEIVDPIGLPGSVQRAIAETVCKGATALALQLFGPRELRRPS